MMQDIGSGESGMVDPTSIIFELVEQNKLPIAFVNDLLMTFVVNQERSNSKFLNDGDVIIKGTPLADLFSCDIADNGETFIAQKFINYLAANPEKLQHIHWRNFEKFCAAYFDRLGFTIELGHGGNDGGIDIVIKDSENKLKSPLIIVRCKRYKDSNDVSIETVKSFSTDVTFTGAKKGIIATTSRIAPGGKTVTIERKFPLEFVEADGIKDWALVMSKPK